ncbi:ferric reductase-like transmembrane domain-containing protein [Demequina sp.]|uniref:ferredoxin reductase family protein n=1 Tax=Demequina sp. TaxID=2050685 RepID=UPI003A898218
MTLTPSPRVDRARAAARRSWWADGLEAAMWLACACGIALMIASGGLQSVSAADWTSTLARALGIVAAVLMMTQVLLASRAPWVERAIGHDRAIATHTRIGKVAIILMLVHAVLITVANAAFDGRDPIGQFLAWPQYGWFMLLAQVAVVTFAIVLLTSLTAVRLRWRYERWHAVHLLVYVGVAAAVPHQFLEGSTFRSGGFAWWFWAVLWTVSIGSFVMFRLARPAVLAARHQLRVASVEIAPDGSTSVLIEGRDIARLRASAGQFFLWRFLAPGLRGQAHPYSLSAAPGDRLRITVKPSGDGSARLRALAPGTRVVVEGPLGVFTHATRTREHLVLVCAGIGITPVLAMLEAADAGDRITVIVRARSRQEAPLLEEVEAVAAARGADLHVLLGSRGAGWGTTAQGGVLADFVDDVAQAEVYICGPRPWALAVEADALAAGIARTAVRREEFGW